MITYIQDNKEVLFIKSVIVRVSEENHQQLKIKTAQEKTSVQEVLRKLIASYLDDDEEIKEILQQKK